VTRRICFACTLVVIIAGKNYARTPVSAYRARIAMAQCRTLIALQKAHGKSGAHDKITELVFFSRWLALSPRNTAAAHGLLQNIPSTEKETEDLMTLSDPPEGINASEHAMLALGNIHDQWPKLAAHAAILAPDRMQNYVAYLPLATTDMHSNFTGNARSVCNKLPIEFRLALNRLPTKDFEYVRNKVFDPDRCEPIFVSEGE